MHLDFKNTWIDWVYVVIIAPFLIYAGIRGKYSSQSIFYITVVLGIGMLGFHMYHLIIAYKKEGFLRGNNYHWTHNNYNNNSTESFVPFSHPYNCETNAYYSYHDTTNTRNCACSTNEASSKCAAQIVPSDTTDAVTHNTNTPSNIAHQSTKPNNSPHTKPDPVIYSDYGIRTMAPVMGRNPSNNNYLL